jgi:CelD/BcsL family acetyltransferase involved in cellulose biosynthesis
MRVCSTQELESSVIRNVGDFAALEREWQELYHNSRLATPFQSWAWLYSWWQCYGADYELRLVTVRARGLLVGLLPLMLERSRLGVVRLLFVGSGLSTYLDVIAREGWEGRVAKAGVEIFPRLGPWQVADLQQLRPDAVSWALCGPWIGLKTYIWQTICPVVDFSRPWDELLTTALNQKQRSNTRRTLRRAEEDGVSRKIVGDEEAEQAARRLVRLHRELWRGRDRDILPEHLTRRFESHLTAAARRMTASGLGAISEFWRGDVLLAAHFLILGRDFVGGYLAGATGEALRRYSIYPLFMRDGIDLARDRDLAYFDLMAGKAPHKMRWSSRVIEINRVVLGRNQIVWASYAGYHLLRSRSVRYVNSGHAPAWVENAAKNAANRSRALRSKLARKGVMNGEP